MASHFAGCQIKNLDSRGISSIIGLKTGKKLLDLCSVTCKPKVKTRKLKVLQQNRTLRDHSIFFMRQRSFYYRNTTEYGPFHATTTVTKYTTDSKVGFLLSLKNVGLSTPQMSKQKYLIKFDKHRFDTIVKTLQVCTL